MKIIPSKFEPSEDEQGGINPWQLLKITDGVANVSRPERQITDDEGRISAPYRSNDFLAALHLKGTINDEQLLAGRRFQNEFDRAHLHPYYRSRMDLTIGCGGYSDGLPEQIDAARREVNKAIQQVGGARSAGGQMLWDCVGEGKPLSEMPGNKHRQYWTGALASALSVLVRYYRIGYRQY